MLTNSISWTRTDVLASYFLRTNGFYVQHKSACALAALTPTVADNHVTVVTVKVTDPYGESASATRSYNSQYASTKCATLRSAAVDGATLTLTYEALAENNLPGTLLASDFTVEVDGSQEVEVTGISAGTATEVTDGGVTKHIKPYTLTLAESVWAGQTATVTYDPADTDDHSAPILTDETVTVSTANSRPTITFTPPTCSECRLPRYIVEHIICPSRTPTSPMPISRSSLPARPPRPRPTH